MNEEYFLVAPSLEYASSIQAFRQEFIDSGEDLDGALSLKKLDRVSDWLNQVQQFSSEATVLPGYMPQTQLLCVRQQDHKVVGVISVRHRLNDFFARVFGHIGYSVAVSERNKGIASWMLHQVFGLCRQLGHETIIVCCMHDNEASRQVILKNHGIFDATVFDAVYRVWVDRYTITLRDVV